MTYETGQFARVIRANSSRHGELGVVYNVSHEFDIVNLVFTDEPEIRYVFRHRDLELVANVEIVQ